MQDDHVPGWNWVLQEIPSSTISWNIFCCETIFDFQVEINQIDVSHESIVSLKCFWEHERNFLLLDGMVAMPIPTNDKVEMNRTTLLSFHCPTKILLMRSRWYMDSPLFADIDRFIVVWSHPLLLVWIVPFAKIMYCVFNITDDSGAVYWLSMYNSLHM